LIENRALSLTGKTLFITGASRGIGLAIALRAAREGANILMLSPPLEMRPNWFAPHLAYTMAKYAMSMCVLGLAEEFREAGVAVNALWPRTIIATAALQVIPGAEPECGRTPDIVADAAWHILTRDSRSTTGNFFIDDEVLASGGITDLTGYAVAKDKPLRPDLFVGDAC
jgi:citronellol/citronellal dehydrogenase